MIRVGAASAVITPELGSFIQAAGHLKTAQFVRDECEANALYLDDGSCAVILVSLDLAGLETKYAGRMRRAVAAGAGDSARGFEANHVMVAGTHMHSGPSVIKTHPDKDVDAEYLDRLEEQLKKLGRDAVGSARPGRIGWGLGEARIGYNRRCCWADGSHSMHGDTTRPEFRGIEGPDDPAHIAVFAADLEGEVLAVVYNNTTHPTSFYGADFFSADFPGQARAYLRETFGEKTAVLYFNGAQGDISFENQLTKHFTDKNRETGLLRVAHQVAGETLRLYSAAELHDSVRIGVAASDIVLQIRRPKPERLEWAEEITRKAAAGAEVSSMDQIIAFGIQLLQAEIARNGATEEVLPIQAVCIGPVALCAIPFELYCQFGLDIKRRSPAEITGIVGIANGFGGYIPTPYAIIGGGYSGEAIHWTRFETNAGYRIVDQSVNTLYQLLESKT